MARLNTTTELFRNIRTLDKFVLQTTTPGSTTTAANAAAQATSISVASITNFSDTDPIFIDGDGGFELAAVAGTPASGVIVLYNKLNIAQTLGATVKEALKKTLGYVEQSGLTLSPSRQLTDILAANADLPINFIRGPLSISCGFSLYGWNLENFATFCGISEGDITGTGASAAAPYQLVVGPSSTVEGACAFRVTGTRYDSVNFNIDFLNAQFEATGQVQMNSQNAASIPVNIKMTGMIVRTWT